MQLMVSGLGAQQGAVGGGPLDHATGVTVVDAQNLVVLLNGFPAIAGSGFRAYRGEAVAMVGPNGAGKTTLLKTLAGLVAPVSGELVVLGEPMKRSARGLRSRVGFMAVRPGLYLDLTVRENLEYFCRVGGVRLAVVHEVLRAVGLPDRLLDVRANHLSTGQARRCGLATLLLRKLDIWLLDEPFAGLDVGAQDLLVSIIRQFRDAGGTAIFVTHELTGAEARSVRLTGPSAQIADRVVYVNGGVCREL